MTESRPEPVVVTAMREFKEGLLGREQAQMQQMAKHWLTVERSLDADINLLARELGEAREAGESTTPAKVYRLERYKHLQAQAQREIRGYVGWADQTITNGQRDMVELGLGHSAQAIQMSYWPSVGIQFDRLPIEAVQHMVGICGDGKPVGNLLKRRMLTDEGLIGWRKLTNELVEGTARGRNPRQTAERMRDALTGGLQKALTIARSEQLRVYRQVGLDQYNSSGVVLGQKRLAAHDGRVCVACIADDGTLYNLVFIISDHPNGRCTSVPVVKGMPEVTWSAGEDWLLAQDDATQRSIMGEERWKEYKEGRFALRDLIARKTDPIWGASITPRSLASMLEQPPKSVKDVIGQRIALGNQERQLKQRASTFEAALRRQGMDPRESTTLHKYRAQITGIQRERAGLLRQFDRLKAADKKPTRVVRPVAKPKPAPKPPRVGKRDVLALREKLIASSDAVKAKVAAFEKEGKAASTRYFQLVDKGYEKAGRTEAETAEMARLRKVLEKRMPQRARIGEGQRARELAMIYVENPSRPKLRLPSNVSRADAAQWNHALQELGKLTGRSSLNDATVRITTRRGARAGYLGRGRIELAPGNSESVALHEMGHWLEEMDPEVRRQAFAFLDRRTKGEKLQRLADLSPGSHYDRDEWCRPDNFEDAYMGKDYGRESTEIISMGLQSLWASPSHLARTDPDLFEFMIDLLGG